MKLLEFLYYFHHIRPDEEKKTNVHIGLNLVIDNVAVSITLVNFQLTAPQLWEHNPARRPPLSRTAREKKSQEMGN